MLAISRRCVGAILTLLLLCPVWGQQPATPAQPVWHSEQIALPATPLAAPLPWVKSPNGPGEFLLGGVNFFASKWGDHQLICTSGGVVILEQDGSMRLLPAAFGQPAVVVGRLDGCLWVQQRDGDLIGLDPVTLAEKERVHGLAGPCFAVDGMSIWCYDREMAFAGLAVTVGNHAPSTTTIIEYSRAGKEKRRFTSDGVSLPKTEICCALVDADVLWVIARPCLAVYHDGGKDYGAAQLLRIDRASGHYQNIAHCTGINAATINLPDNLVWSGADEHTPDTPGAVSQIYLLDKHTLRVTQPATIPLKYARTMTAVQDGKLWCMDYANNADTAAAPAMHYAVFALDGGKRLHVEDAGPPPAGMPTTRPRTPEAYGIIGGMPERAWVKGPRQQLYEIPDTGATLARDFSSLGDVIRFATEYSGLAGAFVGGLRSTELRADIIAQSTAIVKILPGEQQAVHCEIGDAIWPFAASDRRLWFSTLNSVVTCDVDLVPKSICVSPMVRGNLIGYPSVAVGDDLYAYGGGEMVRVDGKTGREMPITSWREQVPAIWRQVEHPDAAFRADDGSIVFNLTLHSAQGKVKASDPETRTVLAAYAPATDKWTVTPCNRMQGWGDILHTPHGALYVPRGDNTLYRGTTTDWVAVGKLPCCMDAFRFGASTAQYLYVDTPLGVYRVRWDELLGPEAR